MNRNPARYAQYRDAPYTPPETGGLERAVLQTIAYADIFDYPLKLEEIHRYLDGLRASHDQIDRLLNRDYLAPNFLRVEDGYFTLPDRREIVRTRKIRAQRSRDLWPKAINYGRLISWLPFVRMVAVTGALAMDNEKSNDIDYLIVTEPRRLWLCRGMVILLVRWAGLHGDLLCPNYFLSENALLFKRSDLYTAHELTQMVPLSGMSIYWKIRAINRWIEDFLPNATGLPRTDISVHREINPHFMRGLAEKALRSKLGGWIEDWEMKRKIRKFSLLLPVGSEAEFSVDWCKGHFGGYGQRTMQTYYERAQVINEFIKFGI